MKYEENKKHAYLVNNCVCILFGLESISRALCGRLPLGALTGKEKEDAIVRLVQMMAFLRRAELRA